MRSSNPIGRNLWPNNMVIAVDEHPLSLNLLLFIRNAWSIATDVEMPELSPSPKAGASSVPNSVSIPEWEDRWRTAWSRAWAWYKVSDPDWMKHPTQEIARQVFRPGQDLHPLIPPLWTAEYGWEGLDLEAFNDWDRNLSPRIPTDVERQSLTDLIPAWKSGLNTVIVLPYAGYFAERLTHGHLVVSAATRNDPEAYAKALQIRI